MTESRSSAMTSPDFKRVTGKLRVVTRRKRSSVLSDLSTSLANHSTEEPLPTKVGRNVNPFRTASCSTPPASSPIPVTPSSEESDCFIPKTPESKVKWSYARVERNSAEEEFVIPKTPDDKIDRYKRRRVTSHEHKSTSSLHELTSDIKQDVIDILPVDYSLYTKVRLTSKYDLSTLTTVSAELESKALADFISQKPSSCAQSWFHRHLHYYTFPMLPWLNLYPRTTVDKVKTNSLPIDAYAALKVQWKSAFHSAYDNVMTATSTSNYFYMLCDGFTVLFNRCGGCAKLSAVISPTTRGLRQNLQDKGVEFTMPIQDVISESRTDSASTRRTSVKSHTDVDTAMLDIDSGSQNSLALDTSIDEDTDRQGGLDEDPLEWLEDIGLEKCEFPSLRAAKVQMEDDAFRRIDYRPPSTLLIVGEQMLSKLKTFLTDYSKTISITGQLANIPPTVLSRQPFLNATIGKLPHRVGLLTNEGGERSSYIDVTGPVLPTLVNDIFADVLNCVDRQDTVNASLIKVNNSHAYNAVSQSCDQHCGRTICSTDSEMSSFSYSNHMFYNTDVNKLRRDTAH